MLPGATAIAITARSLIPGSARRPWRALHDTGRPAPDREHLSPGKPCLEVAQQVNVIISLLIFALSSSKDSLETDRLETIMTYRKVYAALERETVR